MPIALNGDFANAHAVKLASAYRLSNIKPSSERLPTNVTTLSLSWLNGRFRAVAVHKGVIEGSWERPEEVEDLASFPSLLREAIANTGYKGSTVALLLGHPRLGQQYLDSPPTRTRGFLPFLERQARLIMHLGATPDSESTIHRYVQRQAEHLKTFDGDAAVCHEPTPQVKDTHGLLLHLFPRNLLNLLVQASQDTGLFLTSVLPSTTVLHAHLQRLPASKDAYSLLAADTGGGTTTIVVGRSDGPLLLARTLSSGWQQNASRFAVDLKRTILFVNQEFGASISHVWLFGPGATERLNEVQNQLEIPTELSPIEYQELYWAREALTLPQEQIPNFISREQQAAPQRRLWLRIIASLTLILVSLSLLTALFLERLIREERSNLQRLHARAGELQNRHKELQRMHEELLRKQQLVELVSDGRVAPVPGWFLGYLGEVTPPELVLTNFHIKRDGKVWQLELGGVLQPTTNQVTAPLLSAAVSSLTNRLVNGPFRVRLLPPPAASTPEGLQQIGSPGFNDWLARVSSSSHPSPGGPTHFSIEGTVR